MTMTSACLTVQAATCVQHHQRAPKLQRSFVQDFVILVLCFTVTCMKAKFMHGSTML